MKLVSSFTMAKVVVLLIFKSLTALAIELHQSMIGLKRKNK